jgi:two-component system NtrC family sensor kinase
MKKPSDPGGDWPELRDGIIGLGRYSARRSFFPELQARVDQLQASRQQMVDIVEFLPDPTWVIDREGRVIAWNRACETLTGVAAADMVGKGDYEYALPFYGERRPILIDAALMPESATDERYASMSRKDDTIAAEVFLPRLGQGGIHLWMTARPLFDQDGRVTGAIESARDITERKRIEASRAASERKYRLLFENMTAGFALHEMVCDAQGRPVDYRFLEANPAFERLTGIPVPSVIGRTVREVLSAIEPEWIEVFGRVAATAEPVAYQNYSKALDRHFDCWAFCPAKGQFAVVFTDITARKRAEAARELSERRLSEMLESVHLAAVTLDPNGAVTFCNGFLLALTGWAHEEAVGADWFDRFIPDVEREMVRGVFRKGVATGDLPAEFENRIVAKDGGVRMIVWQNTVLHDPDGTISGVASLGRDVTDQRNLEEQLRQSQKMEAIGQLAGGVAHDFNNLLTVIMGYGNLVRMKMPDDSPERSNLDHVLEAAGRATELTRGLLAFSRKQVMTPRTVDLNELIRDVEKFLRRIIGEDIRLQTTLSGFEPTVYVDKGQIEQALINLATNARDAMPKGGLLAISTELRELDAAFIRAHGQGEPGRYAVISVSDTGQGMDEALRHRIFEPFFTTKETGKGTGLGLSIVYGIVKQHNGSVNVYSEPGKGTTFRIYLPLVGQETAAVEEGKARPMPRGGTETILLAEDEPAVRKLVEIVLTEFGYTVIPAEDGQDAVEKFKANRERVSLLLMDLIMPGKNGREAYEEIRRMAPDVRVLFSSGYTADIIRSRGELDEGAELIYKPVDPLTLAAKVREVLDRA